MVAYISEIHGGPRAPSPLKMSPVCAQFPGSCRTSSVNDSHSGATLRKSSACITTKPPTCCAFRQLSTFALTVMGFSGKMPTR